MSAPWFGELRVGKGDGYLPAIIDARDINAVEEVDAETACALVHRANAYPKLREALEAIARNGESYAPDSSEAADLATIARAALASTREEA